jgi:hypothetical protein
MIKINTKTMLHKRCGGEILVGQRNGMEIIFFCKECSYVWALNVMLPMSPEWRPINKRDKWIVVMNPKKQSPTGGNDER